MTLVPVSSQSPFGVHQVSITRVFARVNVNSSCVAAAGGAYAAIAALTNIPATIFAAFLYEFFFVDSDKGKRRLNSDE